MVIWNFFIGVCEKYLKYKIDNLVFFLLYGYLYSEISIYWVDENK